MKKVLLMIVGALILSTSLWAKVLVPLTVSIENDEQPLGNGNPRTPIEVPVVYIDDYTLTFETYHPDYTLIIKDEDGNVVYSTTVFSTQTQVVLPSTLSGNYELQIIRGIYCFYGNISL